MAMLSKAKKGGLGELYSSKHLSSGGLLVSRGVFFLCVLTSLSCQEVEPEQGEKMWEKMCQQFLLNEHFSPARKVCVMSVLRSRSHRRQVGGFSLGALLLHFYPG